MKINDSNIKAYMEYVNQEPKCSTLLLFIWVMCIIGLPTAACGMYSNITKIIMFPIIGCFVVWIVYLIINIKAGFTKYNLFMGLYSTFISISLLLAAYKIALTVGTISATTIFIVIICYIILNIFNFYNTLRLIKKGYYNNEFKKNNYNEGISVLTTFGICLIFGKVARNMLSQSIIVNMLILSLLFLSFLLSMGTLNLLKAYFGKNGY